MNTRDLHNIVRKLVPQLKKELRKSCKSSNEPLNNLNYQQLSVAAGNILTRELIK